MLNLFRFRNKSSRRGGSAIEFALSVTVFWLPLIAGVCTVGFKIIQADRIFEVVRDTGHMYAYGTDFSQAGNQALAQRLAIGYNLSATQSGPTAGNMVLIFTTIKMIGPNDCVLDGASPNVAGANTTNCANLGQYVIVQQLTIGNTSLLTSKFGTAPTGLLDAQGNVTLLQQATNVSLQAPSFGNLLPLAASGFAYLTEGYFSSGDFWTANTTGIYDRAIF